MSRARTVAAQACTAVLAVAGMALVAVAGAVVAVALAFEHRKDRS